MSYTIIYGKQFIKLDDKNYIPIINAGSNNLYEGRKRVRDMYNAKFLAPKIYATEASMIEAAGKLREKHKSDDPEYSDSMFGYYAGMAIVGRTTGKTKYSNLLSLIKDGTKKAMTVEQLNEKGTCVVCAEYVLYPEKFKERHGRDPIMFIPKTSQELKEFIDRTNLKHLTISLTDQ